MLVIVFTNVNNAGLLKEVVSVKFKKKSGTSILGEIGK